MTLPHPGGPLLQGDYVRLFFFSLAEVFQVLRKNGALDNVPELKKADIT